MLHTRAVTAFLAFLTIAVTTSAQTTTTPCPAPVSESRAARPNMFTEQQENDLGDVIAEQFEHNYKVIHGPLNDRVRRIGERLLQQLPAAALHFRFTLVDMPIVNAFTSPGGRIYITRKLALEAQSDDELAGVMGHELGHAYSRDPSVYMSLLFRKTLGIDSVSDRKDIFTKWNLVQETILKKQPDISDRMQEAQIGADQMGVYAVVRAGYDPKALMEFWDRFTENKGSTGNFFTNLFGTTRPEAKRFAEMRKYAESLPETCRGAASGEPDSFKAWQTEVLEYHDATQPQSIFGLDKKLALNEPLRSDIKHFRFSPDGKLLLAQDDASINVLRADTLKEIFRIRASDANPARFTPDSKGVVFYNDALRVEVWDVELQKRSLLQEIRHRVPCNNTAISPDGKIFACFDYENSLELMDVVKNSSLLKLKDFHRQVFYITDMNGIVRIPKLPTDPDKLRKLFSIPMQFSPDGKYFLAGAAGDTESSLLYDLKAQKRMPIPERVNGIITRSFDFLAPDRLIGAKEGKNNNGYVMSFPDWKELQRVSVGYSDVSAPTHASAVILKPVADHPLGILNLQSGALDVGSDTPATDLYDGVFVLERVNGELGLYEFGPNWQKPFAKTQLTFGPLSNLKAFSLSDDLHYLAISTPSRSVVWDLSSNVRRMYLRSFKSAFFAADGTFQADFPAKGETVRTLAAFNLATKDVIKTSEIGERHITFYAKYGVELRSKDSDPHKPPQILEVKDWDSNKILWSRPLQKIVPRISVDANSGILVAQWKQSDGPGGLTDFDTLRIFYMQDMDVSPDSTIEVIDIQTGQSFGSIHINSGANSYKIMKCAATREQVFAEDNHQRIIVFNLKDGSIRDRIFGWNPVVSASAGRLAVQTNSDQIALFDLNSLDRVNEYTFSSPIAAVRFTNEGRRLAVFTESQVLYLIDPKASAPVDSGATAK